MSVYGQRRTVLKQIYGVSHSAAGSVDCSPACECNVDMFVLLSKLSIMVTKTENVISQLFPVFNAKATVIADMKATARMNINTYIWLAMGQYFAKNYPGVAFDIDNRDHLALLTDAYIQNGFPWEDDPILRIYPVLPFPTRDGPTS